MRVRAADESGVERAGNLEIGDELPLAGEVARILLAIEAGADAELRHAAHLSEEPWSRGAAATRRASL